MTHTKGIICPQMQARLVLDIRIQSEIKNKEEKCRLPDLNQRHLNFQSSALPG